MSEGVKSSTAFDLAFARMVSGVVTRTEEMLAVKPMTSLENLAMKRGAEEAGEETIEELKSEAFKPEEGAASNIGDWTKEEENKRGV